MWKPPAGYFAKLRHEGTVPILDGTPTSFTMRSANGTVLKFGKKNIGRSPFERGVVYHVTEIEDRQGNVTRFEYGDPIVSAPYNFYRLRRVIDTLGRTTTLNYNTKGQIASIVDFDDRAVVFTHDSFGRLTEVRSPVIVGTPSGNDFPVGRTTKYGYGETSESRFLLHTITAPEDVAAAAPYLTNTYDSQRRVIKQVFGGVDGNGFKAGGTFAFIYQEFNAPGVLTNGVYFESFYKTRETLQIDPNGNFRQVMFDRFGNDVQIFDHTGRFNPLDVQATTSIEHVLASKSDPLHPTDELPYVTQKKYSNQGLVERIRTPGSDTLNTYDTSADAFLKGNLLKQVRSPVSGTEDAITTIYAYEPIFNQVRASVEARGNDADYVPQNDGANSPNRYMSQVVFDYQEQLITGGPVADLVVAWGIDTAQTVQSTLLTLHGVALAGIVDSCSNDVDLNGDGNQDQRRGNPIIISAPSPKVLADPVNSGTNFDTPPMARVVRYNEFSLPTHSIDALNVVTTYEYNSEEDPDGVAPPTEPPAGVTLDDQVGSAGGGFLREMRLPEGVDETYEYDRLGRTTRVVNGRGAATKIAYNAVGEVVQIEDAKGYLSQNIYDANGRVTSARRTNKVPTYDGVARPDGGEVSGATGDWIEDHFKYDLLDHLIEEDIQADGAAVRLKTRHRYDRGGNRVLTLLPESNADALNVTSVIYDERSLPWKSTRGGLASEFLQLFANADIAEANPSMVSATASTVETAYNVAGLPATVIDGESNTATYVYDGFQRLLVATDPSGNKVTTTYDPPNLVVEVVATDHQAGPPGVELSRTKYKYDELGRCFQIDRLLDAIGSDVPTPDGPLSSGDGFVTERIQFDAKGRVVRVVDDNKVSVENVYDDLDRVEQSVRKTPSGSTLGNATLYGAEPNELRDAALL